MTSQRKPRTAAERIVARKRAERTAQLKRETAQRRFPLLPRRGGRR